MRPHSINGQFILTVYRDYIGSNGQWRLFWQDVNRPSIGLQDQSTVTGQPFFETRKAAKAYGLKHYGELAFSR
jgi:hypothetical protein